MQEGGEDARARVCTEAMDFMEGLRDGWKGLHPPVRPNVVSFSIVIKVGPPLVFSRVWLTTHEFSYVECNFSWFIVSCVGLSAPLCPLTPCSPSFRHIG